MRTPKNSVRILAILIYSAGILLGLVLAVGTIWANLEASFYFGYSVKGEKPLILVCPPLMTLSESGIVTASIRNTTTRSLEPMIQTDISGNVLRTIRDRIPVAAGETKKVTWEVTADDVDFGNLILVKVFQFQTFILPSADAFCGILVLDLPFHNGNQIYFSTLVVSLICIIAGLGLWTANNQPLRYRALDATRAMGFLAILVLAGMIAGFFGWWGAGIILLALTVLMVFVSLRFVT